MVRIISITAYYWFTSIVSSSPSKIVAWLEGMRIKTSSDNESKWVTRGWTPCLEELHLRLLSWPCFMMTKVFYFVVGFRLKLLLKIWKFCHWQLVYDNLMINTTSCLNFFCKWLMSWQVQSNNSDLVTSWQDHHDKVVLFCLHSYTDVSLCTQCFRYSSNVLKSVERRSGTEMISCEGEINEDKKEEEEGDIIMTDIESRERAEKDQEKQETKSIRGDDVVILLPRHVSWKKHFLGRRKEMK